MWLIIDDRPKMTMFTAYEWLTLNHPDAPPPRVNAFENPCGDY